MHKVFVTNYYSIFLNKQNLKKAEHFEIKAVLLFFFSFRLPFNKILFLKIQTLDLNNWLEYENMIIDNFPRSMIEPGEIYRR